MLLTVALLAIYSIYAFLIGRIEDSWPLQVASLVAIVASYGTAMLRPWSRYLVYLLAAGFAIKMALSIVQSFSAGYFDFQFRTMTEILRSLTPSLMLVLLSGVCCLFVFRYFRDREHPGKHISGKDVGVSQSAVRQGDLPHESALNND
jgi:uncharacterized membrane protein (UPF0182 family)